MKNKGIALVMTLWVLVLLTVIAMNLSFSTRHGSRSTRNFKDDSTVYYHAVSTYEEALAYILSDPDPEVDFIDSEGNFRTDNERNPISGDREAGDIVTNLEISDEESRININWKNNRKVFLNMFDYVGIPEDISDELADSLEDWVDEDDLHRLLGAEDDYYEDLGYLAKNSEFEVPEEILLIKGMTPEYFYRSEDSKSLYSLITTWGEGRNVNTLSAEVMSILGLSPVEIDTIISQREAVDGLRTVPPIAGISLTKSLNFRISVVARQKGSPVAVRILSIVRRIVNQNGFELKTLYWKEDFDFESAGA